MWMRTTLSLLKAGGFVRVPGLLYLSPTNRSELSDTESILYRYRLVDLDSQGKYIRSRNEEPKEGHSADIATTMFQKHRALEAEISKLEGLSPDQGRFEDQNQVSIIKEGSGVLRTISPNTNEETESAALTHPHRYRAVCIFVPDVFQLFCGALGLVQTGW